MLLRRCGQFLAITTEFSTGLDGATGSALTQGGVQGKLAAQATSTPALFMPPAGTGTAPAGVYHG